MRLIAVIFELLIFCSVLYIGAGYSVQYFDGAEFSNPDFWIFNLNPRIDRFVYWLLIETGTFLAFFLLAYTLELFTFRTKAQRYILKAIQAYFLGELFVTYLTQLFLSGDSANHFILIIISLFIFINLFILDKYFPRDQYSKN